MLMFLQSPLLTLIIFEKFGLFIAGMFETTVVIDARILNLIYCTEECTHEYEFVEDR